MANKKLTFNFTITVKDESISGDIKAKIPKGTNIGEVLQSIDNCINHLNEMKNQCIIKFVNQE